MSQATKRQSLLPFPRAFAATIPTKRHFMYEDEDPDDIVLTKESLSRFKQALFVRLDDSNSSSYGAGAAVNNQKSMIQLLISRIIRYVDMVGWPDTDDDINDDIKREKSMLLNLMERGDRLQNLHKSVLSPSNSRHYNCQSPSPVKSSDWCLFEEEINGIIITDKENVSDEIQSENVARSIVPSDFFESEASLSPAHSKRSLINITVDKDDTKMNPRENLSTYFQSPDKTTEEIIRLTEVVAMKHVDKETKSYCLNRIKYLKMILEENGFHNAIP